MNVQRCMQINDLQGGIVTIFRDIFRERAR